MTTALAIDSAIVLSATEWLEEAAAKLHRNMRGGYTDGYEYRLADEIAARLATAGDRKAVMSYLVYSALTGCPLIGDVLDECDRASYALAGSVADQIMDLASKQMDSQEADRVLRRMLAGEICGSREVLTIESPPVDA